MNSDAQKPLCYGCVHRGSLPGDCHSSCSNYTANVTANAHGFRHGWFAWPFNFDPMWLITCDGYQPKETYEPKGTFGDQVPLRELDGGPQRAGQ